MQHRPHRMKKRTVDSYSHQIHYHECRSALIGSIFISRFGPRHIRAESPMVRKRNHATGAQPFDTLAVADIGDVGVCLYDIKFVPHFFTLSSTYSRKSRNRTKDNDQLMNLFYVSQNYTTNFHIFP